MSSNATANPSAPAPSSPAPPPSNPPSSADAPPSSAPPPPSPTPNPPSSAPPASPSPPPPASSNPPPPASSNRPPPQSSAAPPPASSAPPANTRTITAPSAPPSATEVQTSIIIITPSQSVPAGQTPSVVVVTSVITPTNQQSLPSGTAGNASSKPSSTDPTQLQSGAVSKQNGLSSGGKTAIAVVIPVVAVALLVLGAILFWRRRKQRKTNEDERRKEVEEYGYNPNHDPTLPAVGMQSEMAEDSSGYRGWGNTTTSSNRKASTTLTSGMTYSDSNSNPGGYQSPNSPTNGAYSDANSNDPLVNGRRETLDSDGIAALGAAPNATNNQNGVHRGPSNASSSYSAAGRSDNSGEYPGMPTSHPQEYYEHGYGSYQEGPYGNNNAYGGGQQQPVIRDVSARRNTRIENPSVFPQQGNSGVATNF